MRKEKDKALRELNIKQRRIASQSNATMRLLLSNIRKSFIGFAHFLLSLSAKSDQKDRRTCDILFLHPSEKAFHLKRKDALVDRLKAYGLIVEEDFIEKSFKEIKNKKGYRFNLGKLPIRFFAKAYFVSYIFQRYSPKVLVNDRYSWDFAYVLMRLKPSQTRIVHLAHSIVESNVPKFGLLHADFAFVFGQSSLDALEKIKIKFGNASVVKTGSYRIGDDLDCIEPAFDGPILLVGLGGKWERDPKFSENYQIISDWFLANCRSELHVKLHPSSDGAFWKSLANTNARVKIVSEDQRFIRTLGGKSVVISIYSNAAIEAGLVGIPIIWVNKSIQKDPFSMEKFFSKPCRSGHDISVYFKRICNDYDGYCKLSKKYAKYHIEAGMHSSLAISDGIVSVLNGENIGCNLN